REVKYFVNDQLFPPGLQPAYALNDGYLVLASSPDAVRRFATTSPTRRPATEEFPLLRMSLKELRQFVQDRREPLGQAIADKNQISKEDAAARLDALVVGLQLCDRLELVQRAGAGQTLLTLRFQTVKPLSR